MCKLTKIFFTGFILVISFTVSAKSLPGIGRTATPSEIAAWDIDVRGDFKGIPKGSGSVSLGNKVWDEKCASCHGTFGESMEVFGPIVGGTTKDDIKTGRVLAMQDGSEPKRSTLMKVSTLSTLWDYINRAMPWNAPKTLTTDEVYGVVAYILNMAEILPANFVLTDKNIAEVQKLMPNRNGMTRDHGLWELKGKADVKNVACMKDCIKKVVITSVLPDYTCDAHGNIAEQNRHFGAVRGADILLACDPHPSIEELNRIYNTPYKAGTNTKVSSGIIAYTKPTSTAPATVETSGLDLLKQHKCTSCHGLTNKIVGPGFKEVADKYKGKTGEETRLAGVVKNGGSGVWGGAMPPHAHIKEEQIKSMIQYIMTTAK